MSFSTVLETVEQAPFIGATGKITFTGLAVPLVTAIGHGATPVSFTGIAIGSGVKFGRKAMRVDSTLGLVPMQTVLDELKADGVDHVRCTAAWPTIETANGTFSWTTVDRVYTQALTNRSMTVSFTVDGMPGWLNGNGYWTPPRSAPELAAWQSFAQTMAARYAGSGMRLIYECWNEPDQGVFWIAPGGGSAPSPTEYAAVLQAFYTGIKAGDPSAVVAGVNCNRTALGYIGAVYDALESEFGVKACREKNYFFDMLAMHPYCLTHPPNYAPSDDTTDAWGVRCRRFLDFSRAYDLVFAREGKHKPLIMGEFGYSTTSGSNGPITDLIRATYIPQAYTGIRSVNYVHSLTWFTYANTSTPDFDIQSTASETAYASVQPADVPVVAAARITFTGVASGTGLNHGFAAMAITVVGAIANGFATQVGHGTGTASIVAAATGNAATNVGIGIAAVTVSFTLAASTGRIPPAGVGNSDGMLTTSAPTDGTLTFAGVTGEQDA